MTGTQRSNPKESITQLLAQLRAGDRAAEERLAAHVYPDLRKVAAHHLRGERRGHSLQPTELVNEVWMHFAAQAGIELQNRAHFFAAASGQMHRILVDRARRRLAAKRGGGQQQVTLEEPVGADRFDPVEVLTLHQLLKEHAEIDPRGARMLEMRYFGGMSLEEIAEVHGLSCQTVKRDLKMALRWLRPRLVPTPR
ncbi:MAG: ECF-type sigma factor [Bryobacteraceae bacterium]